MVRRRLFPWVLALVVAAVGMLVTATAAQSPHVRCFGAAALDRSKPCRNPALDKRVVPTPRAARHRPNAPCDVVGNEGALKLCAFGTPREQSVATVALVGDSHAENWRGAVAEVARAKRWYGISIALGGCPYSDTTRTVDEPLRSHCAERNQQIPGWFVRHPEVHTVFVAQISGVPFVVPRGMSQFEGQVQAYMHAWEALPRTVEHIVVIRDTPKALSGTHACINRALADSRPAGVVCRMPRSQVVDQDAAVEAARRLATPRVRVVNLLDHFCDATWCYPVIGGALVQKDLNHLTNTFMETLGPYLLADVNRVTARAADAPPDCYGAASRDPEHPCTNPDLRYTVTPTPEEAKTAPYSPCSLQPDEPINVCAFGVPADQARATIALLGDSHASHWRAAFETVMQANEWHGVSITRSACPFSRTTRKLRRGLQGKCVAWNRRIAPWFARHPEIHEVFVVQDSGQEWVIPRHVKAFTAEVAGFKRAWQTLPASVQRIVVIRDTPKTGVHSAACIERAVANHQDAGQVCADRRSAVLDRDAEQVAAVRLHSPRVRLLDFTPFFCDATRCFPVIGGVLVHKDDHHLTAAFERTMGPYLLRALERIG